MLKRTVLMSRTESGLRLLTVRHVTRYYYSEPVRLGEHRMMFRPRESHDLRLVSTRLDIVPRPSGIRWLHDVFDNSVAIVGFDQPAAQLPFRSPITPGALGAPPPGYGLAPAADTFPFRYSDDERPDLLGGL